jgi:hypothetical protein
MKVIRNVKLRRTAVIFVFVLSAFTSTSLCAQETTPAQPHEPVTVTCIEEKQLQNQPRQSEQARQPSPPPQNQNKQQTSASQAGIIMGTITDVNDTPILDASVVLQGHDSNDIRSVMTKENGFFEIRNIEAGRPYQVTIRAAGFSEWHSPVVTLDLGQSKVLEVTKLRIEEVTTTVTVTPDNSGEIATQQVKAEERQRGFGLIPNFYADYAPDPAPMNAGLKFRLSLRVAEDPFTFTGIALLAGIGQATGHPDFAQGAKGYSERYSVNYANGLTDIMLDGVILPSLLHQDPRYFYKGTGTTKARVAHVHYSLFVTKGDSGHLQPNYSQLGGDLMSAAVSNFYYPRANRGAGLVSQRFATDTAIHLVVCMLDEFAFRPARGSVAN